MFCRHGEAALLEGEGRALTHWRRARTLLDMRLGRVLLGEIKIHHLVVGSLVLRTSDQFETAHDR